MEECQKSLVTLMDVQDELNSVICKVEQAEEYTEDKVKAVESEYSDTSSKAQACIEIAKVAKRRHWAFWSLCNDAYHANLHHLWYKK